MVEVIRVLPAVDDEQWRRALPHVGLVVVDLLHHEATGNGLPREGAPSRALQRSRDGGQLRDQLIQRSEVFGDSIGQPTAGRSAALGRKTQPEQGMQDMTAQIERQVLL